MEKVCDRPQLRDIQRGRSVYRRVELRSSNCNGNGNGQWNTSTRKTHLKTDSSERWLNVGGVEEMRSVRFLFPTRNIVEISHCGPNREAESDLIGKG